MLIVGLGNPGKKYEKVAPLFRHPRFLTFSAKLGLAESLFSYTGKLQFPRPPSDFLKFYK